MTDKFLKAKHWQLFVLTFGIPLIFQFFMIWFYPVGIWIIQPKINKMIEE